MSLDNAQPFPSLDFGVERTVLPSEGLDVHDFDMGAELTHMPVDSELLSHLADAGNIRLGPVVVPITESGDLILGQHRPRLDLTIGKQVSENDLGPFSERLQFTVDAEGNFNGAETFIEAASRALRDEGALHFMPWYNKPDGWPKNAVVSAERYVATASAELTEHGGKLFGLCLPVQIPDAYAEEWIEAFNIAGGVDEISALVRINSADLDENLQIRHGYRNALLALRATGMLDFSGQTMSIDLTEHASNSNIDVDLEHYKS